MIYEILCYWYRYTKNSLNCILNSNLMIWIRLVIIINYYITNSKGHVTIKILRIIILSSIQTTNTRTITFMRILMTKVKRFSITVYETKIKIGECSVTKEEAITTKESRTDRIVLKTAETSPTSISKHF